MPSMGKAHTLQLFQGWGGGSPDGGQHRQITVGSTCSTWRPWQLRLRQAPMSSPTSGTDTNQTAQLIYLHCSPMPVRAGDTCPVKKQQPRSALHSRPQSSLASAPTEGKAGCWASATEIPAQDSAVQYTHLATWALRPHFKEEVEVLGWK